MEKPAQYLEILDICKWLTFLFFPIHEDIIFSCKRIFKVNVKKEVQIEMNT